MSSRLIVVPLLATVSLAAPRVAHAGDVKLAYVDLQRAFAEVDEGRLAKTHEMHVFVRLDQLTGAAGQLSETLDLEHTGITDKERERRLTKAVCQAALPLLNGLRGAEALTLALRRGDLKGFAVMGVLRDHLRGT